MKKSHDIPFSISQAKKEQGQYCCAYSCTNKPIVKKGGLCHKHYARKLKSKDPVYMRYNQMKSNATRRGKNFSITLTQFREFCEETGYIINKGYRGLVATIDRIEVNKGYSIDNIQILSNRANVIKWHEVDKLEISNEHEELPF